MAIASRLKRLEIALPAKNKPGEMSFWDMPLDEMLARWPELAERSPIVDIVEEEVKRLLSPKVEAWCPQAGHMQKP